VALRRCPRVTPRRKALLAGAALLVLVALLGIGAVAMGWEPVGPADLPVASYAPTPGDNASTRTLDHGAFTVQGTTYEAELLGVSEPRGTGLQPYEVRIVRTGGEGGRVWPASLTLQSPEGAGGSAFYGIPGEVQQPGVEGGALVSRLGATIPPAQGNATVELTLRTYREVAWGVWREDPLTLRFAFAYDARVTG